MKTILVPTDFSKNAETALYYAIELAKSDDSKIILMHAYQINYASSFVPVDVLTDEKKDLEKDSGSRLRALGLKIEHAGKIKHEALCVEDFTVDAILHTIKERKVDLLVMGTKGDSGLANKILGSNTAKVMRNAKCPVLAIPETTKFKILKNITYATNYDDRDIEDLKKVAEMARHFTAHIQLVHITDSKKLPGVEKESFEQFVAKVLQQVNYSNFSSRILTGESIEDALEEFVNVTATDMLVMSTHQKGFFGRLFGESATRHMAYHSTIPIMVIHHES